MAVMNEIVSIDGTARLDHLGVMRARGADAAAFLHGQLTNDMLSLGRGESRWAGFCSAKGRLQANFLVVRMADDEFLLVCSADLLGATLKRLAMFVLRMKCVLSDASAELPLWGAVGASAASLPAAASVTMALPPSEGVHRTLFAAGGTIGPASLPLPRWRWLEVRSGLPWIEAATVDRFVPQMVNQEVLGAVDFRKGCYPGQEVVARSQYRGTIKRRMFLFDTDAPARAGEELFWSGDADQPAGLVVNAAPSPLGGTSLLAEVKLAALEGGSLHLGGSTGAQLRPAALPYPVPVTESA
jgi:folate-binding protein YgfZ